MDPWKFRGSSLITADRGNQVKGDNNAGGIIYEPLREITSLMMDVCRGLVRRVWVLIRRVVKCVKAEG